MTSRVRARLAAREDSLAVQSVILTAARLLSFAITLAIPIVLVRVFDQATFGTYKQLFLIAGTLVPLVGLGLPASLYYFVPRDEGRGHHFIIQTIGLLSLAGGVAAAALVLGADTVDSLFPDFSIKRYMPLVALLVLILAPAELALTLPVVDRRPVVAGFTVAGSHFLRAAAIITVALTVGTLTAVLWAALGVAIVQSVWLFTYVRLRREKAPAHSNVGDLRRQLAYALPFFVAVLFRLALEKFHQYYVAAAVSPADFAIYAIGVLQIPLAGMLAHAVVEVMVVRAAQAYSGGRTTELREVWLKALSRLMVLLLPAWVVGELFAPDLVRLAFGAEYIGSVPILRTFLLSLPLLVIIDHGILRATGDTSYLARAHGIGFVASFLAILALTRYSLPLGAVAGYVLGVFVMRLLGLIRVGRRLDARVRALIPWRTLMRVLVASAVSALAALPAFAFSALLPRLLGGLALFGACYLGIVLRWELIPRSELRTLLRRLVSGSD